MNCVSSEPDYRRVTQGLGLAPESTDLPPYTRRNTPPTAAIRRPVNATLEIHAEKSESIHQITATVSELQSILMLYE